MLAAEPGPPTDADGLAPGVLDGDHVGTGQGSLVLHTVQPEGKAAMALPAWSNGARPAAGERLGA